MTPEQLQVVSLAAFGAALLAFVWGLVARKDVNPFLAALVGFVCTFVAAAGLVIWGNG